MTIIDEKYAALLASGAEIGAPTGPERDTSDAGRFREYAGGWYIYYHSRVGAAFEVHGAIGGLWNSLTRERSALGYPTSDEHDSPHVGRVSHFENGSIYWDAGRGPYEVWPPPEEEICDPTVEGAWQTVDGGSGVVGIHAALCHTNQVLFFTYRDPGGDAHSAPQPYGDSAVLDLDSGRISRPPIGSAESNLFCAGQAWLPDGRLLIGGGEREYIDNTRALHAFTPSSTGGSWARLGNLADGRWYPTCATLPDGGVAIVGGLAWTAPGRSPVNASLEIYSSGSLSTAIPAPFLNHEARANTYPFIIVLPDSRVFMHVGTHTHFYRPDTRTFESTELISANRSNRASRTYGSEGTCVLLPLSPHSSPPYRAKIMMFGGAGRPNPVIRDPATDTCELLDLGDPTPEWQLRATMPHPRVMPDAVLLPDGTVLVINGSSTGHADHGANPVYAADLYDPETDRWTTLCNMRVPRLYHATALLLPDARVLTAGTDSMWNPDPFHEAQTRTEFFSPPYLFRGPRPVIDESPAELTWNAEFEVVSPDSNRIDKAVLTRNGSCTHSFNSDQRLIELEVVGRNPVRRTRWVWREAPIGRRPIRVPRRVYVPALQLRMPPNAAVAPPGYYMLFLLHNGVPSLARFVLLTRVFRITLPDLFRWIWRWMFEPFQWPFASKIPYK